MLKPDSPIILEPRFYKPLRDDPLPRCPIKEPSPCHAPEALLNRHGSSRSGHTQAVSCAHLPKLGTAKGARPTLFTMKRYSHTWPIALSLALVLLSASSLVGNGRLAAEAVAAREQAAAWKTYALTAHAKGLRDGQLDARSTVSKGESPKRLSF